MDLIEQKIKPRQTKPAEIQQTEAEISAIWLCLAAGAALIRGCGPQVAPLAGLHVFDNI